jgi:hypothetical protein
MSRGVSLNEAKQAKAKASKVFTPLVGEVAIGIMRLGQGHGQENFGLKVNLTEPPGEDVSLPTEVDGVPVKVEVVGKIRKR